MSIKYACFISYAHEQGDLVNEFIEQFQTALDTYLAPYLHEKAYVDKQRLSGGFSFNKAFTCYQ